MMLMMALVTLLQAVLQVSRAPEWHSNAYPLRSCAPPALTFRFSARADGRQNAVWRPGRRRIAHRRHVRGSRALPASSRRFLRWWRDRKLRRL